MGSAALRIGQAVDIVWSRSRMERDDTFLSIEDLPDIVRDCILTTMAANQLRQALVLQ